MRDRAEVARKAHNLEVIGSNPIPATIFILMNKKLFNMAKATERVNAIEAGFYDGRFRPRIVEDKRKKAARHKRPYEIE